MMRGPARLSIVELIAAGYRRVVHVVMTVGAELVHADHAASIGHVRSRGQARRDDGRCATGGGLRDGRIAQEIDATRRTDPARAKYTFSHDIPHVS